MMRAACTATLVLVLPLMAAASDVVSAQADKPDPGEKAAVLAVMDKYLAAISADDLETMKSLQTPDGMSYRAKATPNGSMDVVGRPNSYWVDPARKDGHAVREKYWDPTVLIRGGIAVVWAPYEFWIDGKTSHCGIDSFDFVTIDGRWLVANAMWTVEPEACWELRPANSGELRPAPIP